MTSENLSLGEKIKNHRTYINRTLWTSFVALPFMAAYFILGVIMMVSRAINYAQIYHQPQAELYQEKLRAVSRVMGLEGFSWFFVIGIAIMFALQGFSYVFNQSQLDFYLSQPTTRVQRIRKNYYNAMSTFAIIYLACEIVALLVAIAMGAMNSYLFLGIIIETLRNFLVFFTFYNITVLAVMLSGTLPIAILLTACFDFVSIVLAGEIYLFKDVFFATHSSAETFKVFLSPLYDILGSFTQIYQNGTRGDALLSMDYVTAAMKILMPYLLDTLVVGIIALIAVVIFSKNRQSEWAGKSIPLRPFRWVVKIIACFVVGLGSGYFVYIIYDSVWNSSLFTMMLIIMVIATIVTGCIAEVILEGNIKRFFKGKAQTILALCAVVMTFVIFRGDLIGYDSYVPAADKIESAALINDYRSFNSYRGLYDINTFDEEDYMFLTNTEDIVKLAAEGMKNRKLEAKENEQGRYENLGYSTQILYRLKSGRKVYRYISIPYDILEDELDRVISSEEYKMGHFDIFHDEDIRKADEKAFEHSLSYSVDAISENESTRNFSFAKLSDAYRKDILENYSFKYMKQNMPIGSITYDSNDNNYIYGNLDVFENYSNTIEYLKECGIYKSGEVDIDSVRQVKVTNYYPGYDLEETPISEVDASVENSVKVYTDKEQIKEILEGTVSTNYYNPWYNYNAVNDQYYIEVTLDSDRTGYGGLYYSFLKGKVPDFVAADTNN